MHSELPNHDSQTVLALSLLVLRVLAYDHDTAFTLDYLALLADWLHRRSYFHYEHPFLVAAATILTAR